MLIDLLGAAPALVAGAVAVYAAIVLHLVAKDIKRARWQREYGGWRALQRDRLDRRAQPSPVLRALLAVRGHHLPACRKNWKAVQRHRIEHAAVW